MFGQLDILILIELPDGIERDGAAEGVLPRMKEGHGGFAYALPALSLSGLLAPSPRQEQPNSG